MFLSRDSLATSSADWVERYDKIHKNLVKRTRQLKHANHKLANQIAECRRVEEALRQAEEKYRSIFENAVEGIFQTTPDGRYQACNPALARLYGYESPDELLTNLTNIGRQLYVTPQRRDEFIEQLYSCDAVSEFESQVYRKDGSIIWISENARAVRDENGTLLYYEGFVTDITQRKLAEACLRQSEARLRAKTNELESILSELQQTQAQLIQNEKMSSLGQLVAGVAHEINNPVNFVCNNLIHASQYAEDVLNLLQLYAKHYPQPVVEVQEQAEAIELDFLIEDFPKTLSSMQLGADRIRQIVQSLRNFSRFDEVQMTAVNLHEVIDSTLLILQNRLKPNGDDPGITVIKEYGELPRMECYPGLLNQVFMNLLCNAIDALKEDHQKRCITKSCKIAAENEARQESAPQIGVSLQPYGSENSVNTTARGELASCRAAHNSGYCSTSPSFPYHSRPSAAKLPPSLKHKDAPLVDIEPAPRTILIRTEIRNGDQLDDDCFLYPLGTSTGSSLDAIACCFAANALFCAHANRAATPSCSGVAPLTPTGDGTASNHADKSTSQSTSWVVVRIIDNGLGIAEDVKDRIFDPFFTTKPLGKGTGLGLSICYQIIVEKHGGQLKCFSTPNQGTEFVLEIPLK
ncbi:MAG TPA: ATP-binding protein [Coleofasciculaceae cyanobacterium]|jgi:PAS domain S-box-containing protein